MPSYKLTYFDARGLAEPARELFHLAGVPFEDIRVRDADGSWTKIKDSTPFGQIPVLNVDGHAIPQSAAIIRYLANKFGYAGKTAEEQAWADAIVDQFKDFFNITLRPLTSAIREGKPEEEIAKIREEVFIPGRDAYFKILNDILEKSKSGFLVGEGLTFADLVVIENFTTLEQNGLANVAEQPKLAALREKVYSQDKLKEWIASRPVTQF
uniref:glutathione transferase n=1 Tax=Caenorhabditis japonica TaxID=281687 RepID=A0A8R1DXB0_CAEJA